MFCQDRRAHSSRSAPFCRKNVQVKAAFQVVSESVWFNRYFDIRENSGAILDKIGQVVSNIASQ
jgi:hypothetical protein